MPQLKIIEENNKNNYYVQFSQYLMLNNIFQK